MIAPVPLAVLEQLAARRPDESTGTSRGQRAEFDVRVFLAAHGVTIKREKPWQGLQGPGTCLELAACIFDASHDRGEAAVILLDSGMLLYKCHHNSCLEKTWPDVRERLEPIPRAGPTKRPAGPTADAAEQQHTTFRRLRDFLAEPDDAVNWIVDNMLPTGGLALLGAKPKVGKSTLARYIAYCVASGLPCLGRATSRGPVLYVSIEERRRDVRAHFRILGGDQDLNLHVHVGPVPGTPTGASREAIRRHRITWLAGEIRRFRPVLVIIDTWGRFVAVKDGNDYAEATEASEPLIELARSSGTLLLFTHHAKKGEAELIDSLLGSTAIVGSVDTVLLERRQRDKTRTLESNQRVGDDLDETVLVLDKVSGTLQLAGSLDDARLEAAIRACLACLVRVSSATERELRDAVTGENQLLARALREAMRRGLVTRSGEGKARKPYVYSVSRTRNDTDKTNKTDKTDKTAQDVSRPLVRAIDVEVFR